ncbi:MAG: helix-turn-helix domain-containing protein [Gemmatimonadota bacterium]
MSKLHIRIRELRLAKGWTQHQLAEAADTSRRAISLLESDKRAPNLEILDRVAGVLGLSVAELIVVEAREGPAIKSEPQAQVSSDALKQQRLEQAIEFLARAGYRVIPPAGAHPTPSTATESEREA